MMNDGMLDDDYTRFSIDRLMESYYSVLFSVFRTFWVVLNCGTQRQTSIHRHSLLKPHKKPGDARTAQTNVRSRCPFDV